MSAVAGDGWISLPISEIADFRSGDLISVARLYERSAGSRIPVFGGNGIAGYTRSATVFEPTVILGRVGQKCGVVYQNHGPAWITDNALYVRRFRRPVDVQFLAFALEAARLNDARNYNDLPLITQSILRDVEVAWPESVEEQHRITEALSDIDEMIASLERIISKSQSIKQGMMQQLLTGRTRLPGFHARWRSTRIADLLEFKNGLNKASRYFGSGTPIINFMDVMNGPVITAGDVAGRVTLTRDEIKRFSAMRGDLFFTRTSETVDEVGTAAVLVDDIPDASFSGFILRGRPRSNDVDSRFLVQLFQLGSVRKQVTSAATYTTRALTNGRTLGSVSVELPQWDEQRAIAGVIADSDAEIATLRVRLDKARTVKVGMMQQLLTGRIRLPV